MSLLLQALQKAAQNRDAAPGALEPAPSGPTSLPKPAPPEPLADLSFDQEKHEPSAEQTEMALADADVFGPDETPAPAPAEPFEPFATPAAAATSAQAAIFLRASETPSTGWVDWVRDHPVPVFAVGAGIFLLFYSVYVYLEIFQPGVLRGDLFSQTPVAKPPPAAARPINPAAPPANSSPRGLGPAAPSATGSAPSGASPAGPGTTPAAQESRSWPGPAPTPTAQAAPELAAAPEGQRPSTPASATARRAAPTEAPAKRVATAPLLAPSPGPAEPAETAAMENVVTPRRAEPAAANIPPQRITQAYQALQEGKLDEAEALYREAAQADPDSVDAMLGLAAIAAQRGRVQQAVGFYNRALELEPRNAVAQAGLIDMLGQADPATSEAKLKQLIAREPSAFLYFSLGNFYARQGSWPRAQAAYFQAYQMQSDNADYAYDLAVGLEHLSQPKLALNYYRKALELSLQQGRVGFDQKRVIERIGQLSTRID